MIPLVLSVALGVGVYLLYDGLTRRACAAPAPAPLGAVARVPGPRRAARRDPARLRPLLARRRRAGGRRRPVLPGLGRGQPRWPPRSGWLAPFAYYVRRHDRRRAAMQAALAEAIGQLRDAIRSGLSVQEALVGLARRRPGGAARRVRARWSARRA